MTKRKKKLDLPQAIVLSAVLGSIAIAIGLVLTWGPEDSRAAVMEWVALGVAGAGAVFASLRAKGLLGGGDDDE